METWLIAAEFFTIGGMGVLYTINSFQIKQLLEEIKRDMKLTHTVRGPGKKQDLPQPLPEKPKPVVIVPIKKKNVIVHNNPVILKAIQNLADQGLPSTVIGIRLGLSAGTVQYHVNKLKKTI